ncbi:unnamed protein product [Didymodactylos carnosus]|uniref:Uncharacterized protein n=1 Tax=Didymodactylos carnosus TaxID=1234261 RepID=A0A8S2EFI7_9BILA|nr:unnamed protein product [Didymodactylos carnosus]CAF4022648.1 unnamed protein product [Didymodactylos carnosus]
MESLWTRLAHARDDLEDMKLGDRIENARNELKKLGEDDAEEAALKTIANKKHQEDLEAEDHRQRYIQECAELEKANAARNQQ